MENIQQSVLDKSWVITLMLRAHVSETLYIPKTWRSLNSPEYYHEKFSLHLWFLCILVFLFT